MSGKLETLCLASELLPCVLCQVTVDLCVSEAIKCFLFSCIHQVDESHSQILTLRSPSAPHWSFICLHGYKRNYHVDNSHVTLLSKLYF